MSRRTSAELQAALAKLWHEFKILSSARSRDCIIEHYRYLITKTRQRIIPTVPVKILAEDLDQEPSWLHVHLARHSVDDERDVLGHGRPPSVRTR